MIKKIERCRVCGNEKLVQVLDLGEQMLTGVFPKSKEEKVTVGPLQLVKCTGSEEGCGLLQLAHTYELEEMYGENYGYRSGLNAHMVKHLQKKVEKILTQVNLKENDLVIDIGSNDSTTLRSYPEDMGLMLVGIDPTGVKFHQYYPEHVQLIPDFFSSKLLKERYGDKKVKVVTSFSMFYDLENPMMFMQEVYDVLDDNGIWVFEQSYMPTMLRMNSYDTVCHEHLEYYALKQIKWMTDKIGFIITDVEFNDINGGSFSVTVTKNKMLKENPIVQEILEQEKNDGLHTLKPYLDFAMRVTRSKEELLSFIQKAHEEGKKVAAVGASTKGNVILQYCGLTEREIQSVGEVNSEKYGCYTPGTWLPIINETDLLQQNIDYLIVLPWHFKRFFQHNSKFKKQKLVFPLPLIEVCEE